MLWITDPSYIMTIRGLIEREVSLFNALDTAPYRWDTSFWSDWRMTRSRRKPAPRRRLFLRKSQKTHWNWYSPMCAYERWCWNQSQSDRMQQNCPWHPHCTDSPWKGYTRMTLWLSYCQPHLLQSPEQPYQRKCCKSLKRLSKYRNELPSSHSRCHPRTDQLWGLTS